MAHDQLVDLLLIQIEQRGGIVEVDGEPVVDAIAMREVIENFLLAMLPADDPEAAARSVSRSRRSSPSSCLGA
jgi:hypothetical protein